MIDANSKPDYGTLLWVREGLDNAMLRARQSLDEYAENGFTGETILEVKKQLHQIFGTLKMVQVHGAGMLVEEMEAVATAVIEGKLKLDSPAASAKAQW